MGEKYSAIQCDTCGRFTTPDTGGIFHVDPETNFLDAVDCRDHVPDWAGLGAALSELGNELEAESHD